MDTLIKKYITYRKLKRFVKDKNKFNINNRLFNKNITLEKTTLILVWYVLNDLLALNRSTNSITLSTSYKKYYNQLIPHTHFLIRKIMLNPDILE